MSTSDLSHITFTGDLNPISGSMIVFLKMYSVINTETTLNEGCERISIFKKIQFLKSYQKLAPLFN